MRIAGFVLGSLLLSMPAAARDWNVSDPGTDPAAPEAKILLRIEKTGISVVRQSDKAVLREIRPAEVMAIWYDDRAIRNNHAREWWDKMNHVCENWCGDEDLTLPLTLTAIGGVGYLAALPFEEHRQFVNIQHRTGDAIDVLTLRTNWFDHFWLMTDLSQAVGRNWLNIPQQRAKLFWSWADRRQAFAVGSYVGDVALHDTAYNVLLWEDGRGRGVLMIFSVPQSGTPAIISAQAVDVEKAANRNSGSEYCTGGDAVRRLLHVQIGNKQATLPSATRSCAASALR